MTENNILYKKSTRSTADNLFFKIQPGSIKKVHATLKLFSPDINLGKSVYNKEKSSGWKGHVTNPLAPSPLLEIPTYNLRFQERLKRIPIVPTTHGVEYKIQVLTQLRKAALRCWDSVKEEIKTVDPVTFLKDHGLDLNKFDSSGDERIQQGIDILKYMLLQRHLLEIDVKEIQCLMELIGVLHQLDDKMHNHVLIKFPFQVIIDPQIDFLNFSPLWLILGEFIQFAEAFEIIDGLIGMNKQLEHKGGRLAEIFTQQANGRRCVYRESWQSGNKADLRRNKAFLIEEIEYLDGVTILWEWLASSVTKGGNIRICPICQNFFAPPTPSSRMLYCGSKCRSKATSRRYYAKKGEPQ